uniref:Uncharacterized protein n=1 Tax=Globisporangium ultimum (strain ATCC 200006 / CBS 805.95 / DAOM BR144) TaxID=431595 RepID=K3W8H8_GLOUD
MSHAGHDRDSSSSNSDATPREDRNSNPHARGRLTGAATTVVNENRQSRLRRMDSFVEVVKAAAAFDKHGRIQLKLDESDDQYDVEMMQREMLARQGHADNVRASSPVPAQDVPKMNVCIMIVGTRGDVQPFIGIAKRLQQDGHRVRLATHAVYRDFVMEHDVEFYPLSGDPKELAAFMVKTGGHLIPTKLETIQKDIPRNMQIIEEILHSTWPAVSEPDPEGGGPGISGKPFQAQAIISNPVTYGHIHVAERLGVPLHIMFPQPWVPTVAFPHPLSNLPYKNKPSKRNYMSYKVVDLLMWEGTAGMVNNFRRQVLGLRKIRKGDGGKDILLDLCIPHAFMWSPALVPKPSDWNHLYDVIGTVTLKEAGSKYTPTPELEAFLGNDGGPIFVGFGSMVIEDPKKTTSMIIEAAKLANNARVLIQSSWSDMAAGLDVPDNIMFLGNCPHDWLMPRVSAVVHHGGAGTTAAGLLAGKPTFIVPFFGDQPFWGRAVVTAGVGVEPCPIAELTVEKLRVAFEGLQSAPLRANARAMREVMLREDGVEGAVQSFYRHLPLHVMRCDLGCKRLATKWSQKDKIRLCDQCEFVITSRAENSADDIVVYNAVDYTARGPDSILEGAASGVGVFVHELGSGLKDIVTQPIQGFVADGTKALFADHVVTGHYNETRASDERKKGTVLLENKRMLNAIGYRTAPEVHTAGMSQDELLYVEKDPKGRLKADGHRVRIATNSGYRDRIRLGDLLQEIEKAARKLNVRVIFQTCEENEDRTPLYATNTVLEVSSYLPAQHLLKYAHAAVHWGDLSITSAVIAAGRPACVVARNITQRLWGQALVNVGIGVHHLEMDMLSADNLVVTFQSLLSRQVASNAMQFAHANPPSHLAVKNAVASFYANLPLSTMTCDLDAARIARVYDPVSHLKLSYEGHAVVRQLSQRNDNLEEFKYKPIKYSLHHPPHPSLRDLRDDISGAGKHARRPPSHTFETAKVVTKRAAKKLHLKKFERELNGAVRIVETSPFWHSEEEQAADTEVINAVYEQLLLRRMAAPTTRSSY